ncbi:hypothetical protein EAI_06155 [Harpegnathos saltator]|uniref:Uncharacterized protein n=1 Tax=Harpegnathos saltator TaxID=610380 RepID=E2C9N3_HARSA|nr:hypothetical protein EAI_06155 [Harpegnathos saltator]
MEDEVEKIGNMVMKFLGAVMNGPIAKDHLLGALCTGVSYLYLMFCVMIKAGFKECVVEKYFTITKDGEPERYGYIDMWMCRKDGFAVI